MLEKFLALRGLLGGGGSGGSGGGAGGGSDNYPIGDGNTHIWITLPEGRTSPILGVCPNGTVTVDWGDGTEPDVLTGTSTSTVKTTPRHHYKEPGDYVITLLVDGEVGFLGQSSSAQPTYILRNSVSMSLSNLAYAMAVKFVELGSGVTRLNGYSFYYCTALQNVVIPNSITDIERYSFACCYFLKQVVIPNGVTSIGERAFSNCHWLSRVVIPDGVTSIGNTAFENCVSLQFATIPNSVTSIDSGAFYDCNNASFYDFTSSTAVPALANKNAFYGIPTNCEIRVPAALYDEWITATNWATYASKIVAV